MKTGLVLEGGAMRGMFTAGVVDIFLENNNMSKGAQAAQIVAQALKGECGPSGGRDPYLNGHRVGLYSQYPTE